MSTRLAYARGLDGVRALAVTAVLAYHLGTTGMTNGAAFAPGGFLGVDVFFVLSGFLITSLLVGEFAATGRVDIRAFYFRRARRLLPALYVMMGAVAVAATFAYRDYAAHLGGDLLAAFAYVTNWWLIAGKTSYFGAGTHPPLLTHLWSLAVEEQFYLLWPLALILLLRLRRRATAALLVTVAIAGSAVLAAVLFDPYGDLSRIYYGTDTRVAAPLTGALLAILVQPWKWAAGPGHAGRAARIGLDIAGIAAAGLLGVAVFAADDQSAWLYRGGFLVVAMVAGVLVFAAARTGSLVGGALGTLPLRWLGERSYAIYLWHWPVFAVTQPGVNVPLSPAADTAVRLAVTLAIADLSYRFVERPVRGGALGRFMAALRAAARQGRPAGSLVAGTAALILLAGAGVIAVELGAAGTPSGAPVGPGPDTELGVLAAPGPVPSPSASHTPGASTVTPSPSPPSPPGPSPAPTRLTRPAKVPRVAIFGDSQGMTLLLNKPANTGKYVAFTDDTIEGCGILLGKVTSRTGEKRNLTRDCGSWLPTWTGRAERDKPDIGLIMIGAWEVFDLHESDGTLLTFGTPAWDANFSQALTSGITAIRASGAAVALALLPCYHPVHRSAGYWPERGDDDRTRHVNTLLSAAAALDPANITTIEPPHQFCDDPAIAKSLDYRWDGVHYYKPGALLYLTAVIPQLLAIVAPSRG